MSSYSTDQEDQLDQRPIPRLGSIENGESRRTNSSQGMQLQVFSPQSETQGRDEQNQPESFKSPYEHEQHETRVELEPPKLEAATSEDSLKYGIPEKNTKANSSWLAIPKDSPLVQRHWILESQDSEGHEDPLAAIEKMSRALGELISVKRSLQRCLQENSDNEKLLKACQEEKDECEQRYAELVETEKETRVHYEEKLGRLESKLNKLSGEREEADKQHEEDEALLRHTLLTQANDLTELKREFGKQSSVLEDAQSCYKAKQAEVEKLRESLEQREKELEEMGEDLKTKTDKVKELKRKTMVLTISQEKETTKEQLQRCEQIRELVKKLSHITTYEEEESVTKLISEDITRMKATMTRTKSFSWR